MEFARKAASSRRYRGRGAWVGKRKAHLLALQYTAEQIEAMRSVKRRFDPEWLLGRGTLFVDRL